MVAATIEAHSVETYLQIGMPIWSMNRDQSHPIGMFGLSISVISINEVGIVTIR